MKDFIHIFLDEYNNYHYYINFTIGSTDQTLKISKICIPAKYFFGVKFWMPPQDLDAKDEK